MPFRESATVRMLRGTYAIGSHCLSFNPCGLPPSWRSSDSYLATTQATTSCGVLMTMEGCVFLSASINFRRQSLMYRSSELRGAHVRLSVSRRLVLHLA